MMLSLSVNVFAAEPLTDDPNMIEWKYTVFADESLQKVVEEGVIPNAYARYTWRGITLKNGEVAKHHQITVWDFIVIAADT